MMLESVLIDFTALLIIVPVIGLLRYSDVAELKKYFLILIIPLKLIQLSGWIVFETISVCLLFERGECLLWSTGLRDGSTTDWTVF